ncbi:MAG: sigma factor-like helix-turn-helix DNA-binding protein [Acidimicrobiia bacterium]
MPEVDFSRLNAKERRVLKWRMGLVDGTERTTEEIAEKFRRSPRHIDLIERAAHWKLAQ